MYFAYSQAVITNFQFKLSQSQFCVLNTKVPLSTYHFQSGQGKTMYIVASFEHSAAIELALTELEQIGVEKSDMFALPLRVRNEKKKLFDNAHYSDGVSYIDLATILGSICMLLGGIYGFVLKQGPILWALYGLVGGGVLGFLIKCVVIKNYLP